MPLDRLPPAPAPSTPTPQRSSRAAREDAQTFALPEQQDNSTSPSRSDPSDRNADKVNEPQDREATGDAASEKTQDAAAEAVTPETQPTVSSAHTLNEAFSPAQGDAKAAAGETEPAPADPVGEALNADAPDAEASASSPSDADAANAQAQAQRQDPLQAQAEAQSAASETNAAPTTTPLATGQDNAAPEAANAIKPESAAKTSDAAGADKTPAAAVAPETPSRAAPAAGQQDQAEGASQETSDARKGGVTPSMMSENTSDASGDALQDTTRLARDAETARPETRPADAETSLKDAQPKTEQGQTTVKPVSEAQAEAEAKAAPQKQPQADAAVRETPNSDATPTTSVRADQVEAEASTQAADGQGEAEARNLASDSSPGAQNKARHSDKDVAAPAANAKAQSATDAASSNKSSSEASAAAASRATTWTAAASSAQTDPLALLLQDSLASADAPLDASVDSVDAELDLSTVRAEPRIEAARPSQHPQANAASRFAPTTTQTLAAQIARKFNDGGRVFDIRLDPPELGRVEVRLELGPDNKVSAVLSAERADTLSELQRNARDLEKALTDAGLELGEDGLSFSLSEDNGAFSGFQDEADGSTDGFSARNRFTVEVETDLPGAPLADALYGFAVNQRAGVNLIA